MGWALLFAATGAAAQAQAPASSSSSLDEIVVTGIRHSQISALKVKRANEDIVEAISAEDIGKLPDDSIADSIARLPAWRRSATTAAALRTSPSTACRRR